MTDNLTPLDISLGTTFRHADGSVVSVTQGVQLRKRCFTVTIYFRHNDRCRVVSASAVDMLDAYGRALSSRRAIETHGCEALAYLAHRRKLESAA